MAGPGRGTSATTALPLVADAAAADRHHCVCPVILGYRDRVLGHFDRRMRHSSGELGDRPGPQQSGQPARQSRLPRRAEYQGSAHVQPIQLGAYLGDRARSEDDPLSWR